MDQTYTIWTLHLLKRLTKKQAADLETAFRAAGAAADHVVCDEGAFTFRWWNHPNVKGWEDFEFRFPEAAGPIASGKVLVELEHDYGANFGARYAIRRGDRTFVTLMGDGREQRPLLTLPLTTDPEELERGLAEVRRQAERFAEFEAYLRQTIPWPRWLCDAALSGQKPRGPREPAARIFDEARWVGKCSLQDRRWLFGRNPIRGDLLCIMGRKGELYEAK